MSYRPTEFCLVCKEIIDPETCWCDAQNGICAISGCGRQANNVDHSHATGRVRALLCRDCNLALGMLRDCPDRIAGLAEYASKHSLSRYEDVRVISKKAEQPELFALDEAEAKP